LNKTIQLVNLWGTFEEKHPDGSIEDFCRYLLIHQRESENKAPLTGVVVPGNTDGLLLKLMGRIHKVNATYAYTALEGTGLNQLEEFGMLLDIQLAKNPKKTEVIYSSLMELSSGTDMLNRLRERGFITEQADTEDKRSKRLLLTPAGEKTIEKARAQIRKLARMMMYDMTEDDMQLCIKLLKKVEQKFSRLLQGHKGKSFDSIYEEVTGNL